MSTQPVCPRCATPIPPAVRYCGTCGIDLVTGAVPPGELPAAYPPPQQWSAPGPTSWSPVKPPTSPATYSSAPAPMPPPSPPAKPKKSGANGCGAIILGLIVLAGIGAVFGNKDDAGTPGTRSSTPRPPAGQGGVTVRATPRPVAPHTLMSARGSGIKNTKEFAVSDAPWTLAYTYDCSSFGFDGNFIVTVYDGASLVDLPVNELGKRGSDSSEVYSTGDLHLEINSECDWSVTATGQ